MPFLHCITVFKIFTIDAVNNSFIEKVNLRSAKNAGLNFSSIDVAWSPVDENILATGATNGAVVIWNINSLARRPLVIYADHKRTVNTICFHPSEVSSFFLLIRTLITFNLTQVNLLVSCSQDGTMKLFDLRQAKAVKTFLSSSESVRDIQFSPHNDQYHQIASVQENGNVQVWDFRQSDRPERQFTAHNGPVFSIDWHPVERRWLATAGRDKTIKVWDMGITANDFTSSIASNASFTSGVTTGSSSSSSRPQMEYCIQTIAPVARVRWRPGYRNQIASSSLVVDFSVSVWDIRRPFLPCASFVEHKDITRGFVWLASNSLLSAGKDNTLCYHSVEVAVKPMETANPLALSISIQGDITLAVRDDLISYTCLATSASSPTMFASCRDRSKVLQSSLSTPTSPATSVANNPLIPPLSRVSGTKESSTVITRRLSHQPSSGTIGVGQQQHPTISTRSASDNTYSMQMTAASSSALVTTTAANVTMTTSANITTNPGETIKRKDSSTPFSTTIGGGEGQGHLPSGGQVPSSSLPVSSSLPSHFPPKVVSTTTTTSTIGDTQTNNISNYNTVFSSGGTQGSTGGSSIINSLFSGSTSTLSNLAVGKLGSIFKPRSSTSTNNNNQSTKSQLSSTFTNKSSSVSEDDIVKHCSSTVVNLSDLHLLSMEWFVEAAESYQLTGKSFEELCQINADVSQRQQRMEPWNAWRIIRFKYSNQRITYGEDGIDDIPERQPDQVDHQTIFDDDDLEDGNNFDQNRLTSKTNRPIKSIDDSNDQIDEKKSQRLLLSSIVGPSRHLNGNVLASETSPGTISPPSATDGTISSPTNATENQLSKDFTESKDVRLVPSHSVIEKALRKGRKARLFAKTPGSGEKRKGSQSAMGQTTTSIYRRQRTSSNPIHHVGSVGSNEFTYHSDSDDSYVNIQPLNRRQSQPPPRQATVGRSDSVVRETEKSTNFFFGDGDWPFVSHLTMFSTLSMTSHMDLGNDISDSDGDESIPPEAFIQRHEITDFPKCPFSVMKELEKLPGIFGRRRHPSPPMETGGAFGVMARSASSNSPDDGVDPLSDASSPNEQVDELKKVADILTQRSFSKIREAIQSDDHVVENILRFFAAEGDVQTSVSLLVVLGDRIGSSTDHLSTIDETTQEKWFLAYIDLLSRFQLWSVATQVTRLSRVPNIQQLNQNSTNVNLCCGSCGKVNHGIGPFTCKNCNTDTCVCAVCNETVHGLYAWCEGCSHGGHLLHLKDWYDTHTSCPTGCGHQCEYT